MPLEGKGGGNSTCVPRRGFPGGRGARKKLRVHGKVKGTDPEFPKIADFKAFLVHHNALKLEQPSVALVPPSEPAPAIAPAAIMPVDGAVPNPVASEVIYVLLQTKHSGDGHRFVGDHQDYSDIVIVNSVIQSYSHGSHTTRKS